jgi:hypothetical protein
LRWILRSSKQDSDIARKLALIAAIAAAIDSISTYLAVKAGAVELNPIVALFLQDLALYVSFAIVKSWIMYILFIRMNVKSFWEIVIWAGITYLFLRASLINILNYMSRGV